MKSQLHKSIHILYHDVLPTASGMISGGLCMVVAGPEALAGCVAVGLGVYGYVNSAVNTKGSSSDDARAAMDDAVFGYCVFGAAGTCAELAVPAAAADFDNDISDGKPQDEAAKKAESNVAIAAGGLEFGRTVDGLSEALLKEDEAAAAAEGRGAAASEGPAEAAEPSTAFKASVKAGAAVLNYEYANVTCTNPMHMVGRCAE